MANDLIIFLEDACWSLSWILIALASFRSKKAGFPPMVISLTFAVELYLCIHYTLIQPWPYSSVLLINYILWPLSSCFNVAAISLFSRDEFVPGGSKSAFTLKFICEVAAWFLVFFYLAKGIPPHLVMAYFGQTVIAMISLHFFIMVIYRETLLGQSLVGNILRALAGVLCAYVNFVIRADTIGSIAYMQILTVLVVVLDLSYLAIFLRKKQRESA